MKALALSTTLAGIWVVVGTDPGDVGLTLATHDVS